MRHEPRRHNKCHILPYRLISLLLGDKYIHSQYAYTTRSHLFASPHLDADKAMGCEFHSSIIFVVGFIIEYKIAPIQNDKAAIQPLSVVEALAPEFNFSHISKCFKMFESFAMFYFVTKTRIIVRIVLVVYYESLSPYKPSRFHYLRM